MWKLATLFVALCCSSSSTSACQTGSSDTAATQSSKDWWQTAQFYQIYPRSFMDSDGDGIGDLRGITSQLEYLRNLGVTAAWLSPIFTSPMVDFGYDISDFYGIQPEYGTMDDFRALIKRANELGLKIILDFVPNHSSDQCDWFKRSVRRERGYEDYYVWANAKYDASGNRQPPSNWLQSFRGSAWEWVEERQQYYLHQFAVQQADLNYRNPAVVAQMKRIMRYWLDEGVAGFRVDAVPVLFEVEADADGTYPDEPLSGYTNDTQDRVYLQTDLIENRPETIDMVYQWRTVMDDYQRIHGGDTRVLLIETYAPPDYTMLMYGNATRQGAHLPFNFNLITGITNGVTASKVQVAVDQWLLNMPAGRTANWVIGNHDQRRAASRYGTTHIDAMNMLVMTLPGASVTYQGEELGMTDGYISWADTKDPAACNASPDTYEATTRDPERTPFQWNAGVNAGFSTANSTWLPLADNYATVNVDVESRDTRSHLTIYKSLVQLRKTSKTLQYGNWRYKAFNGNVFVLKRSLQNQLTIIYVANFGDSTTSVNLKTDFDANLPATATVLVQSTASNRVKGSSLQTSNISLAGGEALVLSAST